MRVAPILKRLADRAGEDELVVVSHGGVMLTMWAHLAGHWEDAHVPLNCGMVLVEYEGGSFRPPRIIED